MAEEPNVIEEPAPPRDRRRIVWAVITGVAIVAVVGFLILGLANRGVGTSIDKAIRAGERPPAPEFSLPVLVAGGGVGPVGTQASLASLRGKIVVVNMWASWCGPCIEESALLESLWSRYRTRGVVLLGIQVEDFSKDGLAFYKKYGLTYPSVRDGGDVTKRAYHATGVPETFVVDRQGRLALTFRGQVTGDDATALGRIIDQLRREPAPK
jgi:cytochrome c biogenesis protein CcmG, thiol:disulfide interchange protein DsbE